jgi:intraflagellar transport protein 88
MGQYAEAAQAYESIMQDRPNYRCGLNLLLCYHTLGQRDKTRRAFSDLLKIPFLSSDEDYQPSVGKNESDFRFPGVLLSRLIKAINKRILFWKQHAMID